MTADTSRQQNVRQKSPIFTHHLIVHYQSIEMKEEELDALPWINGPKTGNIRGFGFKDKKDPQRYQMMYDSMNEKLWCEAFGLIHAELWDEAEEKVNELSAYRGRCDMNLEMELCYGIAMRGVEEGSNKGIKDKNKFDLARQTILFEIDRDGGSNLDGLIDKLCNLVEARIKALCPLKKWYEVDEKTHWSLDYEKGSTQTLLQAATLWLEVPKAAKRAYVNPTDYGDNAHDAIHCIVEELAKRGELIHARRIANEILDVDPTMTEFNGPGIFLSAVAECSESLDDLPTAHDSYMKLRRCKEGNEYCDMYDEDDKESIFCKDVMPGTVDERITRTDVA